jgi:hypothetical protein
VLVPLSGFIIVACLSISFIFAFLSISILFVRLSDSPTFAELKRLVYFLCIKEIGRQTTIQCGITNINRSTNLLTDREIETERQR